MEKAIFEVPQSRGQQQKIENKNSEPFDPEKELNRPSFRIVNAAKQELGKLFGFGLRSIDEVNDDELLNEINRHFFLNRGVMENKSGQWKTALSDINRDAAKIEKGLAENYAKEIFDFITTESKIKNRFNN